MTKILIFLAILYGIYLLWPIVRRLIGRMVMRKSEDYIRQAMGMPPRPGSRKAHKQEREARKRGESPRGFYSRGSGSDKGKGAYGHANEPIIPKEYAEDVEFVETIEYSETVKVTVDESSIHYESQVSDVEYIEIKDKAS